MKLSQDNFLVLIAMRKDLKNRYDKTKEHSLRINTDTRNELMQYFSKQIKCLDAVIGIIKEVQ